MSYHTLTAAADVYEALRLWGLESRHDRGWDFETHGPTLPDGDPDVYAARITGVGLAHRDDDGVWNEVYIPFAHRLPGEVNADPALLSDILGAVWWGGWAHNGGFELQVSANHGVEWKDSENLLDSQIAHWLAGQQHWMQLRSLALKDILAKMGVATMGSFKQVAKGRDTRDIPVAELGPYCTLDAKGSVLVGQAAYKLLEKHGLVDHFHSLEMPLVSVCNEMSLNGYPIDVEGMGKLEAAWRSEMEGLAQDFAKLTETTVLMPVKRRVPSGEYFKNGKPKLVSKEFQEPQLLGAAIGNDRQVSRWLYEELKWLPTDGLKRNKGGVFDVDKETLGTITPTTAEGRQAVAMRLRYNRLSKLVSTYIVSLRDIAASYADGKLHPHYSITGTVTQRFSSSKPNGQNMPKQTDEAKAWGKCLLVEEGWNGYETDLSQIELRLAAHYSGDPMLLEAYTWGEDIHAKTMALVGCERRPAKVLNFSNLYRISPATLAVKLALQLKRDVSVEEAKDFQERFLRAYAGLKRYWRDAQAVARKDGYILTWDGFKQFVDLKLYKTRWGKEELLWQSGQSAINTPIQGGAGGIIKTATVRLAREWRAAGDWRTNVRLVGQVHDSLRYLVRPGHDERIVPMVERAMCTAVKLRVPVEVETKRMEHGYWGGE
jgi:DNA polymerase-1